MGWLILIIVIVVVVFGPMLWVRWVMQSHSEEIEGMPGTGGELAQHLLEKFSIEAGVEASEIGDHYDPAEKMVRLSPANFSGRSLTAVAVAAHEVGHAIQHHTNDRRLQMRTSLVPVANMIARVSGGMIWAAPIVGLVTRHPVPFSFLVFLGLSGLVVRMLVHLVTLPTELDASFGKALPVLREGKYIAPGEEVIVQKILRAAAMTYVAAALADVLNLARWAAMLLRR
ncbi:MAG: peptidase [Pseudomonadales bacterium]|nr:peptidase [Pseudomonadales bacterium]